MIDSGKTILLTGKCHTLILLLSSFYSVSRSLSRFLPDQRSLCRASEESHLVLYFRLSHYSLIVPCRFINIVESY